MEIKLFYPGFVKKSIAFTIDDGNIDMDAKFIAITKPYGIKGTFNICEPTHLTPEEYRIFYSGYEIANHVSFHPAAMTDGEGYVISDGEYVNGEGSDNTLYRVADCEGLYKKLFNGRSLWNIADDECYIRLVYDCHQRLEAVFGKGSVRSFVWPFGEQKNEKIKSKVKDLGLGYYGVRKTGYVFDTTGYSLPADWNAWSYNCGDKNLLSETKKYEEYADDGELKFFVFGLHSIDYENNGTWGNLEEFVRLYGNRPDTYWYATVGEIYDYSEALKKLYADEEGVLHNPTDIPLYVEYNGEKMILEGNK